MENRFELRDIIRPCDAPEVRQAVEAVEQLLTEIEGRVMNLANITARCIIKAARRICFASELFLANRPLISETVQQHPVKIISVVLVGP